MNILHIFRTPPDKTVEIFMKTSIKDDESKVIELYKSNIDWSRLVDDIFSHKKVICWW
jgi:hypothetical protein